MGKKKQFLKIQFQSAEHLKYKHHIIYIIIFFKYNQKNKTKQVEQRRKGTT